MRRIATSLIRCYQVCVSPLLGPHCRFHPTCSQYAQDSILSHGLMRGAWLAIKRVLRCNPWNPGGFDPAPGPLNRY